MRALLLIPLLVGCAGTDDPAADTDAADTDAADTDADTDLGDTDAADTDHTDEPEVTLAGCVKTRLADNDADGDIENLLEETYDARALMVLQRYDDGNDGTWEEELRSSYDDEGRIDRLERWSGTTLATVYEHTWTPDASVPDGVEERIDVDHAGDGSIEIVYRRVYDGDGRMWIESTDWDVDGDADYRIETDWDAWGNASVWADYDGDGEPEMATESTCHGYQLCDTIRRDSDGDGDWDQVQQTTFDESGLLAQEMLYDTDGDGDWDASETYTYDDDGRLAEAASDSGNDGSIETRTTFGWDADGNPTELTTITATSTRRIVYGWLDGQMVSLVSYTNDVKSWEEAWAFGERGETSYAVDQQGDGVWDQAVTWSYDCPE